MLNYSAFAIIKVLWHHKNTRQIYNFQKMEILTWNFAVFSFSTKINHQFFEQRKTGCFFCHNLIPLLLQYKNLVRKIHITQLKTLENFLRKELFSHPPDFTDIFYIVYALVLVIIHKVISI